MSQALGYCQGQAMLEEICVTVRRQEHRYTLHAQERMAQRMLFRISLQHRAPSWLTSYDKGKCRSEMPRFERLRGESSRSYGVIGLPTTFLVARDGWPVVLAIGPRAWGSAEVRTLIRALLVEPMVK